MKKDQRKIVFMGTPYFARNLLASLITDQYHISAVVTQPDKPVGRKRVYEKPPVKLLAEENDVPVYQPLKIKEDYQFMIDLNPDLIITCAYGQLIPKEILDNFLCINVHASLLPKLRGGAPMHRAIMNGDQETGITLMKMAQKMDAGDIIVQEKVVVENTDTVGSLQEKLIICAIKMMKEYLPLILDDKVVYTTQEHEKATFGYNINKEEEYVSFDQAYQVVYDHIRALIPWPIAYGVIDGIKIRFHSVRSTVIKTNEANGTLIGLYEDNLAIAVDHRLLLIKDLQVEGRNVMSAKDFMNGKGKSLIHKQFM